MIGKWLFALLVAYLLVTLGARLWWGWDADRQFQAEIDGIRQRGEPVTLKEMKPPPIQGEDAFDLYKKAAELPDFKKTMSLLAIPKSTLASVAPSLLGPAGAATTSAPVGAGASDYVVVDEAAIQKTSPYAGGSGLELYQVLLDASFRRKHPAIARQFLAGIPKSLALVRVARGCGTAHGFNYDAEDPISNHVGPIQGFLSLARALRAAAVSAHELGDDAAAVGYIRDSLALANSVEKTPALISDMVGISIRAITCFAVEDIAPTLRVGARVADPQEVSALIRELADVRSPREHFRNALIGERNVTTPAYVRLADDPSYGASWDPTGDTVPLKLPGPAFWLACKPSVLLQAREHIQFINTHIARAGLSDYSPPLDYQEFVGDCGRLREMSRWLNFIMTPALKRAYNVHFRAMSIQQMAAVALAIRLYECDRGRRPEVLAELCPKYLPAVPADPFDSYGNAIRYLPNAKHPILYLVGQDRKDDHGRFAANSPKSVNMEVLDMPFFLNADREQACLEVYGKGK